MNLNEIHKTQIKPMELELVPQELEVREQAMHTQQLRRSSRNVHPPERWYGFLVENQDEMLLIQDDEPTTYEEAIKDVDASKWLVAMKSEMGSMCENKV